jgi:hypothetical protein
MFSYNTIVNAGKNRDQQKISNIKKPPMFTNDERIRFFFRSDTDQADRVPTILATDVGIQCAFISTNKVKLMTAPNLVDNSVIGFSLTDDPTHHAPTTMTVELATTFFLSIVPHDLATLHSLSTLAVDPLALAPLPNGPQAVDRLHPEWYDATDPATNPVFAWIPKIAKLPYDHNIVDGMVIAGLNTNNLTMDTDSIQYMWLIATSTLHSLNNGTSFHHQTNLFDIGDLLIDGNNSPIATSRTERMAFAPGDMVPLLHGIHDAYQTIMHSVQNTIIGSIIATNTDNIIATTTNPEPVLHRTETELKHKKESDKRAELWRQLLACPAKDENGNDIIYFPELNESFKEVLAAQTVAEANDLLIQYSHNFTSTYQDTLNQGILGEISFSFGKHLSSALIRMIQLCAFNKFNLNTNPEAITNGMTGFAFLTPQEGTTNYESVVGKTAIVMQEVAVGVDSTKQQKMPSQLYIGGQASSHSDFVSMGANVTFLFMLALQDPIKDKPMIIQLIEKQVSTTRSIGYRKSIQFHTDPKNGNIFFIPHLVNDTSDLMASFARSATSFELTTARAENDMAKIVAHFKPARDFLRAETGHDDSKPRCSQLHQFYREANVLQLPFPDTKSGR